MFFHFISLIANYRDLSWGHVEKVRESIPKGPKRSALRIVICPDPSTLLLGQDHRSSQDLDTCFASLSLSAMKRPFWKGNSNHPTYRPYGYLTTYLLYNSSQNSWKFPGKQCLAGHRRVDLSWWRCGQYAGQWSRGKWQDRLFCCSAWTMDDESRGWKFGNYGLW